MKKLLEIPKEMNDTVKMLALKKGISANEFILRAVRKAIPDDGKEPMKKKTVPEVLPKGVTTGNRVVNYSDKQHGMFKKVEGYDNVFFNGKCFKKQEPGKQARYKYAIEDF